MTSPLPDLPGVTVSVAASNPSASISSDTGAAFLAGLAAAGPTNQAVACYSMDDYTNTFGARDTGSFLYDACDVAFREGAQVVYVGRETGPAPVNDSVNLKDASAANSISVSSNGPTDTGWSVAVTLGTGGAGTVVITVTDALSNVVVQSPTCTSLTDLLSWGQSQNLVKVAILGTNMPAVAAAAPMVGGTDDRTHIDWTNVALRQAALLRLFPRTLGPGQMAYPGVTSEKAWVALANAASLTNRVALLDMPDSSVASSLVTLRSTFLADTSLLALAETYVAHLTDWHLVPGVNGAAARPIPPSAFWAGLIAANDALTGNPNAPAAGAAGILDYSIGKTQPEWSDTDRNTLNVAHINPTRLLQDGSYRIYGYRSGANPAVYQSAAWTEFSNVRMRMKIIDDLDAIGEDYIFDQLDGKGQTIAAFNGAIAGQMTLYWSEGALYGDTASDAFDVVTAAPVNNATTAAAQQLNAKIGAKLSPYAEKVFFGFTKQAITEGN